MQRIGTRMKPNGVTDTESEESGKSQKRAAKKIRHSDDEDYKPSPSKRKKGKLSKSPRKTHGPNAMNQGMWNKEREAYLCEMWEEEECLYKVDHPLYRCPTTKAVVLKRIASSLGFVDPELVAMHMRSMRTVLGKACQAPKSGVSPKPPTTREVRIVQLCGFLREHIARKTHGAATPGYLPADQWKRPASIDDGTEPWELGNEDIDDADIADDNEAPSTSAADSPSSDTTKAEEADEVDSIENILEYHSLPKGLVKNEVGDNDDDTYSAAPSATSEVSATSETEPENVHKSIEILQDMTKNIEKLVEMTARSKKEEGNIDHSWARVIISYIQKMPEENRHLYRTAAEIMAVRAMNEDWKPDFDF